MLKINVPRQNSISNVNSKILDAILFKSEKEESEKFNKNKSLSPSYDTQSSFELEIIEKLNFKSNEIDEKELRIIKFLESQGIEFKEPQERENEFFEQIKEKVNSSRKNSLSISKEHRFSLDQSLLLARRKSLPKINLDKVSNKVEKSESKSTDSSPIFDSTFNKNSFIQKSKFCSKNADSFFINDDSDE